MTSLALRARSPYRFAEDEPIPHRMIVTTRIAENNLPSASNFTSTACPMTNRWRAGGSRGPRI
jgi:hypothetical protein